MNGLTFSRTVARELAHRASVAEVFVTSVIDHGAGRCDIGVQLPRSHAFYGDTCATGPARHDPVLFVEACRQACLVTAHHCYGVPLDARFVLRKSDARVHDQQALLVTDVPCDAVLRCRTLRRFEHEGRLTGLCLRHQVEVDGRHAMTADFDFSWLSERAWTSMRTSRGEVRPTFAGALVAARCPATAVGRLNPRNVMIGPPEYEAGITRASTVVDTGHPTMFDHPIDHLPAMFQVEAFRQLATACVAESARLGPEHGLLTALRCQFHGFAELGIESQCHCQLGRIQPADGNRYIDTWCWLSQSGQVVAEGELRLTYPAATAPNMGIAHLSRASG